MGDHMRFAKIYADLDHLELINRSLSRQVALAGIAHQHSRRELMRALDKIELMEERLAELERRDRLAGELATNPTTAAAGEDQNLTQPGPGGLLGGLLASVAEQAPTSATGPDEDADVLPFRGPFVWAHRDHEQTSCPYYYSHNARGADLVRRVREELGKHGVVYISK